MGFHVLHMGKEMEHHGKEREHHFRKENWGSQWIGERGREKRKGKEKKKKENWRVIGRREGNFSCCIPSLWLERGLTEDGEKIKERKRNKGMWDTIEGGSGIILEREKNGVLEGFFERWGCDFQMWNQIVFWKRFGLLFGLKLVCILEEIRATVRGEISPCFGRDSG